MLTQTQQAVLDLTAVSLFGRQVVDPFFVSDKVVKIIQSYTGVVNKMVWRKF